MRGVRELDFSVDFSLDFTLDFSLSVSGAFLLFFGLEDLLAFPAKIIQIR